MNETSSYEKEGEVSFEGERGSSVSHEALRYLLKDRGLADTEENKKALQEYALSAEYRDSERGRAAQLFEDSLLEKPLEMRLPSTSYMEREIAQVFVDKVVREEAYQGMPHDMVPTLELVRDVFAGNAEFAEYTPEQITEMTPKLAKEAALETEFEWARSLVYFSDPILTGDKSPLNMDALERQAQFALRAEESEITEEAVQGKIAENLRKHMDALSFWRGYLAATAEWDSEYKQVEFDTALFKFGIQPDGNGAYFFPDDTRERRAGGDMENFIEGMHGARELYPEDQKRESEKVSEQQEEIRQQLEEEERIRNAEATQKRASDIRRELTDVDAQEARSEREIHSNLDDIAAEEFVKEKKKFSGPFGVRGWIEKITESINSLGISKKEGLKKERTEALLERYRKEKEIQQKLIDQRKKKESKDTIDA